MNANTLLTKLGFRFGSNGPHAARTMMLDDLRRIFSVLPVAASKADYAQAIGLDNLLNKPTKKARDLAMRHLFTLYGFDVALPLFRVFRRLWESDATAAPLLALMAALARDPLLRSTQDFILGKYPGETVARGQVEALLASTHQDRFSAASLKSFAQNVGGTWTQAGYLSGHTRKTRSVPLATPAAAAFALFLAYLEGATGQRLFASSWVALLPGGLADHEALANAASHRGLIVSMQAGGIKEIRFPGYLTGAEDQLRLEASHVV